MRQTSPAHSARGTLLIEFSLLVCSPITPFSRDGEKASTVHNHKDLRGAGVARPAMACLSISWQSPQHTPSCTWSTGCADIFRKG